ncbi:monoamine oxidase [Paraburkholderia sp. GV068]|uniref:flavin monoamine oxidase family protein n=1 Tax=unclassified Paraburkholderia TaxID=2615204 RepID=UPI000D3077D1|nr:MULTISPECIES: FAD-dependent oxidoreductase [unclassified Paraburkholderia]PTQ95214.1 monoamine oxidase [Paraburkholderia sp. GV072]PUB01868.1 monoamine oxidase [Paraburkholderia sp. GV068]
MPQIEPGSSASGHNPHLPPPGGIPAEEPATPSATPQPLSPSLPTARARGPEGSGEPAPSARPRQALPASKTDTAAPAQSKEWPARISMRDYLTPENCGALARDGSLSMLGRALPRLTPQTVGRYFKEPVGDWPRDRNKLGPAVSKNLTLLASMEEGPKREQLHLETTLQWHALCEAEQGDVLEALGTRQADLLGDTARQASNDLPRTPVRDWLEHSAVFMKPETAARLLNSCTPEARQKLDMPMQAAGDDADLKALLKDRFTDLRMTMPLDHMYDYTGFWWDNNRQVGMLPEGVAENLKVCVVGAGPAGIMAADALNRIGVKPVVLEQADHIGGRIASGRWEDDPTPYHPGGMRFHTTRGNFYWSLAEHYGLEHVPFPNSSSVQTSYLIGGKVYEAQPGEAPENATMRKVAEDVMRSMTEPLLAPIREARDAGDTARFRELCDDAKQKFDSHTFQSGLKELLKEKGITWNKDEWRTFGATGIGVGGYSGYFSTGFLEEFRFLADERLEDHVALVDGADAPLYKVIEDSDDLPEGAVSLAEQNAIQLNAEVTSIKKVDGKYQVTWLDKTSKETKTAEYDELFFAGGPREAVRLGLTGPQEGSEPLLPDDFAAAVKDARVVPATKMAVKIAADLLEDRQLPGNVQADELFQQSYVVPARDGGAVVYPSYTLGDNSTKVAGMTGREQMDLFIQTLRNVASRDPENPSHKKLADLADVVEQSREGIAYTHWGLERHQWGAFKMDGPDQLDNTRTLYAALLRMSDGAIAIGEELTFEGGFASGALASATHGVQQFVRRQGGTLPPNSPYYQELL